MIHANELRIGNWVMWQSIPILIDSPQTLQRTFNKIDEGRVAPIPLTPEILEKAGFEKYTEVPDDGIGDELEIWNNYCIDVFFDVHGALVLKDYHVNINRPKYLHQLQNLYWCLCGEELKIDL